MEEALFSLVSTILISRDSEYDHEIAQMSSIINNGMRSQSIIPLTFMLI
jgi:hypothetical protein